MCFSAEASFGLSAVLLPAGAYCVRSAVAQDRRLLGLAALPLVFGVQQFCEGWVWTGLGRDDLHLARTAAIPFLYFALAFWPFWVPLYALLMNGDPRKRWVLAVLTALGFVGGLLLYIPVVLHPDLLVVTVRHHSVSYDITHSAVYRLMPVAWWQGLYLAVVALPVILAPARGFTLFGVMLIAAAVVSHAFYWYAFASVWCFFAAVLSLYLCYLFRRLRGSNDATST